MTQTRVQLVLSRLMLLAEQDEEMACLISDGLNEMCDSFHDDDLFGTEGQLDPRGDQRDGYWSMSHVQGVDAE